jgi:hypothetical protein
MHIAIPEIGCVDARERTPLPPRHCERSEAIHIAAQWIDGLLRRYAPRNDGSPINLLASLP